MCRKLICLIGLIAVFAWSANALAATTRVDEFDSYSTGLIGPDPCVASPPWTVSESRARPPAGLGKASVSAIASASAGRNQYLSYGVPLALGIDETFGVSRALPTPIPKTDTATTLFLRFYANPANANNSFGLTAVVTPNIGYFTDYQVQMACRNGQFSVRNGAAFIETPYDANTWYDVWAVVNHSAGTFDVYLKVDDGTGATVANKIVTGAAYRTATELPLAYFDCLVQGSLGNTTNLTIRLDDIYVSDGNDLTVKLGKWASTPHPADNSTYGSINVTLAWTPGRCADKHDVYFDTDFNDVNNATRASHPGLLHYSENQPNANYPVGGLNSDTTYYWRIDEVNNPPTTIYKGEVWRFKVPGLTAYNPSPADGAILVVPDANLSWSAGVYAVTHDVNFGTDNPPPFIQNQPGTLYDPGTLLPYTTYYWQITEVNGVNTWPGPVWSFTTRPNIPLDADPNLVGWWKFDDGEGGAAFDWSGHNRHGTLHGDPNYATGIFGQAIDLDGINDFVSVGSVGIGGATPRTIAGWVKMNTTTIPAWANVFGFAAGGNYSQFDIVVSGGNAPPLLAGWYAIHIFWWQQGIIGPDLEWHHLAATYDGTTIRWYHGGSLIGQANPPILTTINNVQMGKSPTNASYFPGLIDDVRIYNRVLSETEIQAIMASPQAYNPNPENNDTEVDKNPTLTWKPGWYAAVTDGHELYFSNDFNDVNERKIAAGPHTLSDTSYTPGPLPYPKTYYWRVDEVNGPNTWPGIVWRFTVPIYKVVDNFELYFATGTQDLENPTYPLTPDGLRLLRRTWIDGLWNIGWTYPNPTTDIATSGSYVQLNTDPCDDATNKSNIAQGGTQSMKLYYDNDGTINWVNDLRLPLLGLNQSYGSNWNYTSTPNYYSEASAAIDDAARFSDPPFNSEYQDSLGMLRDWSGYKVLKLSYYGDPNNTIVPTDKLYVTLKDGSNRVATVTNPDQTYIQRLGWHDWYIPLSIGSGSFKAQNASLDLTNIARIYIGIGTKAASVSGGRGAIFFDDIRLYPVSICVPSDVKGDFNGDCKVDANDLQRMSQIWLVKPTPPTPVIDINTSNPSLPLGTLSKWRNNGSADGNFVDFNSAISGYKPKVQMVEGVKAVVFDGNDVMRATISAPASITGSHAYTVIYKVWNLEIGDNERVFSWAKRGTTARYAGVGYSSNAVYGAVGHQDPNFDMGFNGVPAAHTWHTIAVTYPGGPNSVETLMVDGVVSATEVKTLNLWPDCNMTVGAAYDGNSTAVPPVSKVITPIYFFSGALANLKVYSVAMSTNDLKVLTNTPIDMKQDYVINFKDLALFAAHWRDVEIIGQ